MTRTRRIPARALRGSASIVLAWGLVTGLAAAQIQGPSSSQAPYVLPVAPGVRTVAILTVGDSPAGSAYRLVGIPDGLGVYGHQRNRFTLLMNHELSSTAGAVRAHGQKGAFVSRWEIRRSDFLVLAGEDLIRQVELVTGGPAFSRFCSGNLPAARALYPLDPFPPVVFLNGEEVRGAGRAFAHFATGPGERTSHELVALGKLAFENVVARPFPSFRTVVAATDDSSPGQVYFYIGFKRLLGDEIVRAGLTGGSLHGVRVPGVALEDRSTGIGSSTRFELASLGDVSAKSGAELQDDSVAAGVTEFLRPEDCAWHPRNPRLFYFVTTDRLDSPGLAGRSRLWELCFDDPLVPELGGRITMLLDGTEGQQMLDNLTVDRRGNILMQEDTGNDAHLARIWRYTPANDSLEVLAQHDASRFTRGAPDFLTEDEESSGIVDAWRLLGPGWFLFTSQAHYSLGGELVEGGQLLALYSPTSR